MRRLAALLLLPLAACQIAPVEPTAARLEREQLVITFSDGRTCDLAVRAARPREFGPTARCPPLEAGRIDRAPGLEAPEILLNYNAERPLQGDGPPAMVTIWTAAGPYRFSR